MITSLGHIDDPRDAIANSKPGFWHLSFDHLPEYTETIQPLTLQVLFEKHGDSFSLCLFNDTALAKKLLADQTLQIIEDTEAHGLAVFEPNQPWPLEVLRVEKPWGAEVWYTGIEKRGVCTVKGLPLPWLLACVPEALIGTAAEQNPLLLKILDPLPNPDLGNLYFELHDKKIEVYIVTHVDRSVWPDGVGKIRYGFNQAKRQAYPSDDAFKAAYLEAVKSYQTCRNEIDQILDKNRLDAGVPEDAPIPAEQMSAWLSQLPDRLKQEEQQLKAHMSGFTHVKDLREGDVVRVEPFFPHSLQHGVRVIEFQTASYERFILSFDQKVLTQNHWDTEAALAQVILSLPPEPDFDKTPITDTGNTSISHTDKRQAATQNESEIIADFSAFTATRLTMAADTRLILEDSDDYGVIIVAKGSLSLAGQLLEPEDARLLPARMSEQARIIDSHTDSVCIIARPKP